METGRYELDFDETFDGETLDHRRWIAHYLPHWSTWEQSAARYAIEDGCLTLLIVEDQPPWCLELDGDLRVSSLQTGLFAGPPGTVVGQHRFDPAAIVRDGPHDRRLYTPRYGRIELRAQASDDPRVMVALWMIGFEDAPEQSAEICVCEIFGRDVTPLAAGIGVGLHPYGDPTIVDAFARVTVPIDARDFHVYAADWTPERVVFSVDGHPIKTVDQSPSYPMQLMLNIYEFPAEPGAESSPRAYPKRFVVDFVRGYRYVD